MAQAPINTVQQSTTTDPDPRQMDIQGNSPTTLVMRYLQSQGQKPSSENIRRALEANARDPSLIPELRGAPDPVAQDQPSVGKGGSAAAKIEGGGSGGRRGLPVPPIPPGGATPPMDRRDAAAGDPDTSAPPVGAGGNAGDIAMSVLGLGGAGLAGLYGASKFFGRPMPTDTGEGFRVPPNFTMPGSDVPTPGAAVPDTPLANLASTQDNLGRGPVDPSGRMMDVDPTMIAANNPRLLSGPQGGAGDATQEAAMLKALSGPTDGPVDLSGLKPRVSVSQVTPQPPPGVSENDLTRAAVGNLTRNNAAEVLNPPQTVPFVDRGVPRVPPTQLNRGARDIGRLGARILGRL